MGSLEHVFLTIATRSYAHLVEALINSYLAHNDGLFFIAWIDDAGTEPISIETPAGEIKLELDMPREADGEKYTPTERCCLLKPFITARLLEKTCRNVTYLDGDCFVLGDVSHLANARAPITLTPHSTAPQPPDGGSPSDLDTANAGVFNGGFFQVAASDVGRRFVTWWYESIKNHCFISHYRGLFVDQKVLSLAPVFFPEMHILRDPGINWGYWRRHESPLSFTDAVPRVGSAKLLIAHLSGLEENPARLSRFTTRTASTDEMRLARLYRDAVGRPLSLPSKRTRTKCERYNRIHERLDSVLKRLGRFPYP